MVSRFGDFFIIYFIIKRLVVPFTPEAACIHEKTTPITISCAVWWERTTPTNVTTDLNESQALILYYIPSHYCTNISWLRKGGLTNQAPMGSSMPRWIAMVTASSYPYNQRCFLNTSVLTRNSSRVALHISVESPTFKHTYSAGNSNCQCTKNLKRLQ